MPPSLKHKCPRNQPNSCTTFDFISGDAETRAALHLISVHLETLGLSADCIATTELVLAEVLNNITEHAYAGRIGAISVALHCTNEHLAFRVTDRGRAMPGNSVPIPPPPDPSPPDNLPEGGFGWYLIHLLTTKLSYQRMPEQNILAFRIGCATAPDSAVVSSENIS